MPSELWRRTTKITWLDKVTYEEVLGVVNGQENTELKRKIDRDGHVRHDGLLHEVMRGKPRRGRRRIQMLHDLAKDDSYVALKRAAEEHREDVKNLLYSRRL